MTSQKSKTPSSLFTKTIRRTLKQYHNATWLGENSPLATPYFLGSQLSPSTQQLDTVERRGQVLQRVLYEAATRLWAAPLPTTRRILIDQVETARVKGGNKGGQYAFYILELRYFRKYFSRFNAPLSAKECAKFLAVSEARFFIHVEQAIDQLTWVLLKQIRPTFRLEQPRLRTALFGRMSLQDNIVNNLKTQQAVMLSGPGGIGKTTLGTAVCTQWQASASFWFTVRPKLNDQFNSLVFALAHFLHQQGQSLLWLQLMADGGRLAHHKYLLGFLEQDLKDRPLLCFDEVDRLDSVNPEHAAIIELLDSLVSRTPILLMGQMPVIDTPIHYQMSGLALNATTHLLQSQMPNIGSVTVAKWHQATQGNPRLLMLCSTLDDDPKFNKHKGLDVSGPFQRLWLRLSSAEQHLLTELSVYRSPAPLHAWQKQTQAISTLIKRQLLYVDTQGGIEFVSPYRRYLYDHILLQEQREQLHQQAGIIRIQVGEYTAAAYHYYRAGKPSHALNIWYTHRELEIGRGFAASAREIFTNLSINQLSAPSQKKLRIVRNQLFDLAGQLNEIVAQPVGRDPAAHTTREDVVIAEQEGRAWSLLGQSDQALASYDFALGKLAELMEHAARIRFRRGQIYRQTGDLQDARQEVRAIYAIYKRLAGGVAQQMGEFEVAEQALLMALDSAETSQHAELHHELAIIYGKQGRIDLGRQHAEQAIEYYAAIGHRHLVETVKMDLAGMHLQVGQYAEVVRFGEPALQFFRGIQHQAAIPALLNNLAEAYFEQGDTQTALSYAQEVIYLEERGCYPYASYTLGRIHMQHKAFAYAHVAFEEGLKVASRNEDKFISAYLLRERGWLYLEQGEQGLGSADLATAKTLFQKMNLIQEAQRCHSQPQLQEASDQQHV